MEKFKTNLNLVQSETDATRASELEINLEFKRRTLLN